MTNTLAPPPQEDPPNDDPNVGPDSMTEATMVPPEILQLWAEVANGIDKSQTGTSLLWLSKRGEEQGLAGG